MQRLSKSSGDLIAGVQRLRKSSGDLIAGVQRLRKSSGDLIAGVQRLRKSSGDLIAGVQRLRKSSGDPRSTLQIRFELFADIVFYYIFFQLIRLPPLGGLPRAGETINGPLRRTDYSLLDVVLTLAQPLHH